MRKSLDHDLAFECLRLANNGDRDSFRTIEAAGQFYAFVTGEDTETDNPMLALVRAALWPKPLPTGC